MVSYPDSRPTWAGKVYTSFQTKTAQKIIPFGAVNAYVAYISGVPPRVFSNPKDEITCKIKQLFSTLFPRRMKIILLSYSHR